MINKNINYENIELYDKELWKERYSIICPLANFIGEKNHEIIRDEANLNIYENRNDGIYDSKTKSVAYEDIVKFWSEKGLFYKCTEMAGVCWIAMIPHNIKDGMEKNPEIVVVLHDVDYSNKNWAMNTIEFYKEHNEIAIKENKIMLYVSSNGPDKHNIYISILQELSAIFHFNVNKVYLDLTILQKLNIKLKDIEQFNYKDCDGNIINNPDNFINKIGEIPVLDISGRWQNRVSGLVNIISEQSAHSDFKEGLIYSPTGKKLAEAIKMEYDFQDPKDANFLDFIKNKGVEYNSHIKNGEQWIALTPNEKIDKKLPVMLIFAEVNLVNEYRSINALSAFYEYIDLVAQGELIVLFFALETPNDNDLFYDILQDALTIYPIDKSRVYVTGHSHNGHFAMEFVRRHHESIAAVASLGMVHGLPAPSYSWEVLKVTDEMVNLMSTFDVPTININGYFENDLIISEIDSERYKNSVDAFQRRLKAYNCEEKSYEEIVSTRLSSNNIIKKIGIPADEVNVEFKMGFECYIADLKNKNNKNHLRFVTVDKLPHMPFPQMVELSWEFVKRFSKDLSTGKVVEHY